MMVRPSILSLSWKEFETSQPEMARFGDQSLRFKVMYLATIKADGYPRVHPFTPFVGSGHLFAFMEPTSPKAKDLLRNGKYAMHSLVADEHGSNGEFEISGDAKLLTDPESREDAVAACPYEPRDRYILFEFKINSCLVNRYENGNPNAKRWKSI